MVFRMMSVLLVVILLFGGAAGSAFAQDAGPVLCGDLSEADCAIVEQSNAAMHAVTSSAFALDLDMALTVSDPEFEGFEFALAMDGAAGADPATLEPFMALQPKDMAGMMDMMDIAPEMLAALLQGVDADVVLELDLPAELLMEMGMVDGMPPLELLMVDGVVYFYLGAFMPEGDDSMPPWMGIDLAAMTEGIFAMMEDEAMMEEMPSDMMDFQAMFDNEALWAMYDPEFYNQFVSIERIADDEIDGQPMAVFQMDFDYAGMFASEEYQAMFSDYMAAIMEMQGESMDEMPDNFMDIVATMMDGMVMTMEQWIGLEDSYIHLFSMDMAFDMDFQAMAEMMPEEDMSDAPEEFSMEFSMTMESSDFNVPVEVVAPEGAQVIDPMMFMGMAPTTEG